MSLDTNSIFPLVNSVFAMELFKDFLVQGTVNDIKPNDIFRYMYMENITVLCNSYNERTRYFSDSYNCRIFTGSTWFLDPLSEKWPVTYTRQVPKAYHCNYKVDILPHKFITTYIHRLRLRIVLWKILNNERHYEHLHDRLWKPGTGLMFLKGMREMKISTHF